MTDRAMVHRIAHHLRHEPFLSTRTPEEIIDGVRLIVEDDLRQVKAGAEYENRDLVIACLEACIQHLGDASLAEYASRK